jgi:hypothetical protein
MVFFDAAIVAFFKEKIVNPDFNCDFESGIIKILRLFYNFTVTAVFLFNAAI